MITIGFSQPKTKKIGSELIKWWINKPYSHTFIKYVNPLEKEVVFHAAHGNVHQILWKNFIKENTVMKTVEIECNQQQYEKLVELYFEKCGTLYSTEGLFWIFIHDLLWKMNIYIKTFDDPGYICSELVASILENIFDISFKKPLNIIRPDDVEKRLINE